MRGALRSVHEWHSWVLNAPMGGAQSAHEWHAWALKASMRGTHGRSKRPRVDLVGAQSIHAWHSRADTRDTMQTWLQQLGPTSAWPTHSWHGAPGPWKEYCRPGCSTRALYFSYACTVLG